MSRKKRNDDPLPIEPIGNGSNIMPFDFDEADFLMLAAGLSIARNTAMMCGGPDAARRLEYYRLQFVEKLPASAKHVSREETLAEAIYAIRETGWWSDVHHKQYSWSKSGETLIKSGDKVWSFNYSTSPEEHQEILDAVRQLAPMSAEERPWEGEEKANQR